MNTVNLAPADLKKEGAGFDLPFDVRIPTALEVVSPKLLEDYNYTLPESLNPPKA